MKTSTSNRAIQRVAKTWCALANWYGSLAGIPIPCAGVRPRERVHCEVGPYDIAFLSGREGEIAARIARRHLHELLNDTPPMRDRERTPILRLKGLGYPLRFKHPRPQETRTFRWDGQELPLDVRWELFASGVPRDRNERVIVALVEPMGLVGKTFLTYAHYEQKCLLVVRDALFPRLTNDDIATLIEPDSEYWNDLLRPEGEPHISAGS